MARYECVEGGSSKFWEISLEGASLTTRWGRIGTRGQSLTRTFATPAEAGKQHDTLVQEKLKKGYAPVASPREPVPPSRAAAGPAPTRADLSVYNEATGFLVTSGRMMGREIRPGEAAWVRAVEAGDILPIELVQDDGFNIRVVVNDRLSEPESEEWVGRLAWRLRVPDGALAVTGGIEFVMDPSSGEHAARMQEHVRDFVRFVDVPPGDYEAQLLCYIHGVNGDVLLERAGDGKQERLGAWFRRTRPGEPLPVWLTSWLRYSPREDPGHEEEWERKPAKRECQLESQTSYVDFLLHLTPIVTGAGKMPALERGFFSLDAFEARRPQRCPAGILARDLVGREEVEGLEQGRGGPAPVETVDVLSHVGDRRLAKVKGGPVEHPIAAVGQVYKLAWLATDTSMSEIRVELPVGSRFVPTWPPVEDTAVSVEGGILRVGIARPGGLPAVRKVGARFGDLPEGSTLELLAWPGAEFFQHQDGQPDQDPDAGVHRYRGVVGGGLWRIEETFPALEAATLREALAFSAAVDAGGRLPLRDEAEAEEVMRLVERDESLYWDNPVVRRGLEVGLKKKDVSRLHHLATSVFRTRWRSVWPCQAIDEAAEDALRKAQKAWMEALGERLSRTAAAKGPREPILEGRTAAFEKIDILAERPLESEIIESTDRQLAKLGYLPLGDLVCSRFQDVFVRGYARPGGDTWGALLCGVFESTFDFVTHFERDAGLSTTLKEGPTGDQPEKGLYRSRFPKLDLGHLEKLHQHHLERKDKLVKKLGNALPTPATLRGLAESIDAWVARELH